MVYPNVTSFDTAKKLYKSGLKIKPQFEDLIQSVMLNLEPSFKYKRKKYGSTKFDGYEFFEWKNENNYQAYKTIEEFEQKANIDGKLLCDIWKDIYQYKFGC